MKFQDIDSETLPKSSGFLVKIMHRMSTLLARNTAEEFASITRFNIVEWRVVSGLYAFGASRQKRLVDYTAAIRRKRVEFLRACSGPRWFVPRPAKKMGALKSSS